MKMFKKFPGFLLVVIVMSICMAFTTYFVRKNKEQRTIVMRDGDERIELDMENFLIYCMANDACISISPEYLKLRAVMIRTEIVRQMGKKKLISSDELDIPYVREILLRQMWEEAYEENLMAVQRAIKETKGEIVTYKEKPARLKCHMISNGETRSDNDYTKCVVLDMDKASEKYSSTIEYTFDEIREMGFSDELNIINKEKGYVTEILCDDNIISGEEVATALKLPSCSFDISKTEEGYTFTTYGIGDGYGISLNGAASMANEGKSYRDILGYFLKNIKLVNE